MEPTRRLSCRRHRIIARVGSASQLPAYLQYPGNAHAHSTRPHSGLRCHSIPTLPASFLPSPSIPSYTTPVAHLYAACKIPLALLLGLRPFPSGILIFPSLPSQRSPTPGQSLIMCLPVPPTQTSMGFPASIQETEEEIA